MPRSSPAATRWTITWNFPDELSEHFDVPWENCPGIVYGIGQLERAPTTGRLHLQAYVELASKRTLSVLSDWLPGAHFEIARGTAAANIEYCSKSDTRVDGPWEYGDRSAVRKQGKRSDLLALRDGVMSGLTDRELLQHADLSPVFLRYHHLPALVRRLVNPPRLLTEPPTVVLAIGGPGTGKSHYAREHYRDAYWKPSGSKWWDDYAGESVVVLDDFAGHCLSFTDLKRVLDKNPFKAEVKGSFVELQASTFIITTNRLPDHWYSADVLGSVGGDAIWRRITRLLLFETTNGLRHWKEITDFEEFRTEHLIKRTFS